MSDASLRDALRAIIAVVGGHADERATDEFLASAPAEVLCFVRKITAERDKAVSDREMLLSMFCSVPDNNIDAATMGMAYWEWRAKMKDAIASARALQHALSKQGVAE